MWCSKILVAYDGSAPSRRALDLASSIAAQDSSVELVLVHVMKLYAAGAATVGVEAVFAEDAEGSLSDMQRALVGFPNKATTRLLKGTSPADLILKCAEDEGCDLIIMGSRGKGGVKGYLGSVSYAVVQKSPVAVLIAKEGEAGAIA